MTNADPWSRLPSTVHGVCLCVAVFAAALAAGAANIGTWSEPGVSRSKVDDPEAAVEIPDAILRGALENALGKDAGEEITVREMASLGALSSRGVRQLAGMEYAVNLGSLTLTDGSISDLSPLRDLTSLTHLNLWSNDISDATPLAHLSALTSLRLGVNRLTDLSPLAGLGSLTTLGLDAAGAKRDYADRPRLNLSPLGGLTSLKSLTLHQNKVTDLTPLADLASLEYLGLQGNNISDLSPLAGLTSLTHLDLYANLGLSDLSALAGLKSLRWMQLGNCGTQLRDVSPLAGLESLESAWLPGNGIVDLSPFAGLASLRRLGLDGNNIADVSSLARLTSLTSLGLSGNPVSDLSPLQHMVALTSLSLVGTGISDVSTLVHLTSLNHLDLRHNAIAEVSPLLRNAGLGDGDVVDLRANHRLSSKSLETDIPQLLERGVEVLFGPPALPDGWEAMEVSDAGLRQALERGLSKGAGWWIAKREVATLAGLVASDFAIEDLAGLQGAKLVRRLDLSGNAIVDLQPLAELDVLLAADGASTSRVFFLDGNNITDVGPLSGLPSLIALTLSDNTIEDVAPLTTLENLHHLALDGNSIRHLPPLPLSLRRLHLSNNELSNIDALSDLWLQEVSLSGNSITSIAPLAGQRLRYLHLNRNQVADLTPLNTAALVELHAKDNALRDISPLLAGEALLVVDVRGNPLAHDALGVLEELRDGDTTVLAGEAVPYFPADGPGRTGFLRVINHSDEAGEVFVEAVDDAGVRAGPVRLTLGAQQAVHFNSADLENGNVAKGLDSGIGPPAAGDWRLALISPLDIEVLSYVRTEDGFVTAMHDVAADGMLPTFNPGSNQNQRSILRVVNTEAEPAKWTTGGYDDRGKWHPMAGSIEVHPGTTLTLTAAALENTHGLGNGQGKWRLRVRGFPWYAMSLLESPTGHLTNLSTAPDNSVPLSDGGRLHRLPLFPAASAARAGFARVINRSPIPGRVTIEALDDSGTRFGPVSLDLGAGETVHFNSHDLEAGNPAKGLSGGVGLGEGDWRLELTSTLDLQVLSYIRTVDGFLTSMHDVAPRTADGNLRIPFFNPGSNSNQVSSLRLVNWHEAAVEATITGVDDTGWPSPEAVRVTIPAEAARTFTAEEIEAGSAVNFSGALGYGDGKWRLSVATSDEVDAMSVLSLPTGHITNLSTTRRPHRQR